MEQSAKKHYTVEEYLALEDRAEYKSEYYRGEIFAMFGGTPDHNRISGNVYNLLSQLLRDGPCEAFIADIRVQMRFKGDILYTYPDVIVVCGALEFASGRTDTIVNPVLVVEVLSTSTRDFDETTKFDYYKTLASLQNYVLMSQDKTYVRCFQRWEDRGWLQVSYNDPSESLYLPALAVSLPLEQIYRRVEFPARGGGPVSE